MSREAELYKDKIEVSLDGRQIFYLFFGGAVIVGLVFVLGVMVGRRVEARGHTDRARVAATVDPLAALDRLEGGSGLSFQGALRGADGPVSDVEKTIAAMPKRDDKKLEAVKVEPLKADVKIEPKVEAKVDAKVEKKTDEPKVEHKADDAKPEAKADKPLEKKADAKTETKNDVKTETNAKTETKTDAKVDAKTETKTDAKAEAPKEPQKAKFTLQLSSFQDRAEAQAYLESIKSAGYTAHVTEGVVDGKQYFRVRMGAYKNYDAAMSAKTEFEKTAKKIAIVTKL
jgi:DedD protein